MYSTISADDEEHHYESLRDREYSSTERQLTSNDAYAGPHLYSMIPAEGETINMAPNVNIPDATASSNKSLMYSSFR